MHARQCRLSSCWPAACIGSFHSKQFRYLAGVESEHDLLPLHQERTADQIGIRCHQLQRPGARRRILFHVPFAVELVARIQEKFIVPRADEPVQFFRTQAAIEIDLFKLRAPFAKETLRVAAARSSWLQVKFHGR